jgi:alpha-galactosidase
MPDETLDAYTTRSFMFGGPWVFMNRLPELTPEDLVLAASEIAVYKKLRGPVREGRVSHLTARPAVGRIDAMQSFNAARNTAVAIVTREDSAADTFILQWRDLPAAQLYQVRFETASARYVMTGEQLMTKGIVVSLESRFSSEIVYLEPAA